MPYRLPLAAYRLPLRPLSSQLSALSFPVVRRFAEPFLRGLLTRHWPRPERLGVTSPYRETSSELS
jgi:hypothetical protein